MQSAPAHPLPPERWSRLARTVVLLAAWLALTIYFHTPVRTVMEPTLDGSNSGSYAYFTAHHFQYGTEVVPMAGPYGFIMYGWTYSGELFGLRTAGELALNGTLAALSLWFFALRGSPLRWVWLAAHLLFTPYVEDLPLEWLLLLGGLYLLQADVNGRRIWRALPVTTALALVSLVKGTQLILGLATMAVVFGGYAARRRWPDAFRLAAAYALAVLFWWLLAGQNPLHLPAYLRGALELGGGYTDAMSLLTPPDVLERALLVSAGLAALLGWAAWRRRHEALMLATLLLLAGHTFVQWKHAIVRSDGHAMIYFSYAFVAALAIHLAANLPSGRQTSRDWQERLALALLGVTLVFASWGPVRKVLLDVSHAPRGVTDRLAQNAGHLLQLGRTHEEYALWLQATRRAHSLPAIQAEVGNRPIDALGYEQGLLQLNHFNYRPRPMGGGSFNVYTPYLMELNRDFLRDDAKRPDFYLLKPQTIDTRLLAADDGLALLEVLQRYQPVLLEQAHLLMANPGPVPAAPRVVAKTRAHWDEFIRVPAVAPDEMLLMRLNVRAGWLGPLPSLLYKSPETHLETFDAGNHIIGLYRIIPAMVGSPFLLSPQLDNYEDVISLYAPGAGRVVTRFRLTRNGKGIELGAFGRTIDVEFLAAPRPPALSADRMAEMRGRLEFPFANVLPTSVTPAFRANSVARYLHAPSEAVWALRGDERAFSFHFGIDAEAYEKGTTNGVEFIAEIRGPSGGVTKVFSRMLRPKTVPVDRGDQEARMVLPVFAPGSRLVLRTDPGEFGDNSWDWAYAYRIDLARGGPYAAKLFPGFNRVPDQAEDENAAALELDGRPAFLLHVPGSLHFKLTGREKKLDLDFGFLPGAYTNGGQTPGAEYIVELVRAGQPAREIFRRRLQPVAESADRGHKQATIPLPEIAPGDIVTVRTAPVPGGTASWGWTYISRLLLE